MSASSENSRVSFLEDSMGWNVYIYIYIFAIPHGMWDLKFPHQDLNPRPLQWNFGVLTIGLPGKSLYFSFEHVNIPQTGDILEERGE